MISLKNYYRQYAVMLVANKLYQDYCVAINNFEGIEPEEYQEVWLEVHIVGDNDHKFRDDICEVFMTMLQESGKKNG